MNHDSHVQIYFLKQKLIACSSISSIHFNKLQSYSSNFLSKQTTKMKEGTLIFGLNEKQNECLKKNTSVMMSSLEEKCRRAISYLRKYD
jgi:uncharacterized protein YsxB (DUF464 family)